MCDLKLYATLQSDKEKFLLHLPLQFHPLLSKTFFSVAICAYFGTRSSLRVSSLESMENLEKVETLTQ